jgi:molybdopterin synthase catalytic subunit/molybdopterin converting factor small subunit
MIGPTSAGIGGSTSPVQAPVRVLLFGVLRERLHSDCLLVSEPVRTVADVWAAVAASVDSPPLRDAIRCARNLEYCTWQTPVQPGDELAFMPPVCGGAIDGPRVDIALVDTPIAVANLIAEAGTSADGAVACFVGRVRDNSDGDAVSALDYEAYGPMALTIMRRIAVDAAQRQKLSTVTVVHRVGALGVGEAAVVVIASSPHRQPAFDACREIIDAVKEQVPIWKREHTIAAARWVDARHVTDAHV